MIVEDGNEVLSSVIGIARLVDSVTKPIGVGDAPSVSASKVLRL